MGRPKLPPEKSRSARFNIRVRPEFADWAKELAGLKDDSDITAMVIRLMTAEAKRLKFKPPPER